jgi:4a-hydroxytetrahydrobiopterin dehydratase
MEKYNESTLSPELEKLNGWKYSDGAIEKIFVFKNFRDAFTVMNRIAFEIEEMNHHPDWFNSYNKLNIRLSTHSSGGVTEKDITLAKKIDAIIEHFR